MAKRQFSRVTRIFSRIPLRIAMKLVDWVAYFNHRWYMAWKVPLLRWAGMHFSGTPRYVSASVFFDDFDKITLGDRVVISSHVSFLTHDYSLTTALIAANEHSGPDVAIVRPITVGNNVFIGRLAMLMPGTEIGNNVIVGAGSVVRGRVPDGAIVMGNPAQQVMTIEELHRKHKSREDATDVRVDSR